MVGQVLDGKLGLPATAFTTGAQGHRGEPCPINGFVVTLVEKLQEARRQVPRTVVPCAPCAPVVKRRSTSSRRTGTPSHDASIGGHRVGCTEHTARREGNGRTFPPPAEIGTFPPFRHAPRSP